MQRLLAAFNEGIGLVYHTRLVAGEDEPIYWPARDGEPARIVFAHGFLSSALHEIAHWCIAGFERRQLEDYGYWYQPDGRSEAQQLAFEAVEARPQALEKLFRQALGMPFEPSLDNLSNPVAEVRRRAFAARIEEECDRMLRGDMPYRGRLVLDMLRKDVAEVRPA